MRKPDSGIRQYTVGAMGMLGEPGLPAANRRPSAAPMPGPTPATTQTFCDILERLLEGSEVELVCPGGLRLLVQVPVGIGEAREADEAVLAHRLRELRDALDDLVTGDAAVDDDVTHVDSLRTVRTCHRLRERTQPRFGRREGRRVRFPSQRRGRAGEEHG